MTQIYLENGQLDLYKQDIEWEWKTVRFSDGMQDQYSTDITIPKNGKNLQLLGAAGLLDRTQQPFGDMLSPCTLSTGQKQIDAYLEVISVTEDEINICVYERTIDNTNIKKWLVDDNSTIFQWNVDTRSLYPNDFRMYWYGMGYNENAAQLHPYKPLNTIIDKVSQASGITIPHGDPKHCVVATNKYVCPQNKRQVIEGHWTKDSGEYAVMSGGQHVTNDLEWSWSPDVTEIKFNRRCKATINVFYAWEKKGSVTNRFWFNVVRSTPQTPDYVLTCFMNSNQWANRAEWDADNNFTFEQGSTLKVHCISNNLQKYKTLDFVMIIDYRDYDIVDDDYGIEMQYVGRLPRLKVPSNDKKYSFGVGQAFTEYDDYQYLKFDGGVIGYHYNRVSHPAEHAAHYYQSIRCSFCYFGYYANLADIEVKDLLFGLSWLDHKKIAKHVIVDNYAIYPTVEFVSCDESIVVDGIIKETRMSDDRLGQNNYILQTDENPTNPVVTIPNKWLEESVTLHQSPFTYTPKRWGAWGCIDQYSNMEYNDEDESYKCDFENVEGFCIMDSGQTNTLLYHPEISTMDFEKLTQSIGVTIETTTMMLDFYDFVFLDGRKYFVVEGNTDLNTNITTLTCLLVPMDDSVVPTSGGGTGGSGQDNPPHDPNDPNDPDDPDQPDYPDPDDPNDPDHPDNPDNPYYWD